MAKLLDRYQAGEFERVWQEIRSHARIDVVLQEEVMAVAVATMRRVAHNADLVADRLRARGWKASFADLQSLRTAPEGKDAATFARIEELTGSPIPPSLLAFWKVVGGINWVWDYRLEGPAPDLGVALPMDEMDPLCVDAPSMTTYLFDEWIDLKKTAQVGSRSFRIDLAPDYLHKANISGGPPYAINVPFLGADPIFAYERHELPFVDYLRLGFRWAGFPGLEEYAYRQDVQRFVREFGQGLLPF